MPYSSEVTLVATTQSTFTLDLPYQQARISTDGSAEVWYTSDGSTATVGSGGNIPAVVGETEVIVNWPAAEQEPGSTVPTRVIKVISSGTPKVTVEAGIT